MQFIVICFVIICSTIVGNIQTLSILSRKKRIVGGHPADPPPDANFNDVAETQTGWGHIEDKPIVFVDDDVQSARILGTTEKNQYYSFRGIPYAEPPLNEFRFQRPRRHYLEGEINADKNGAPCLQPSPDSKNVVGDEDCLTLNVYTPKLPSSSGSSELLPVIFWIHGGGYRRGSGLQYDPSDLVMKNTVVVTIQYRLGSLGFLSSNQKDLPGNVGLLDMSSALFWTRHYIQNFGGDPNKITVAGQGSGASAGMLLSMSKLTSSAIQGVVAMSGSAISSFAVDSHPQETYANVTRKTTICGDAKGVALVKCLQEAQSTDIIYADTEVENEAVNSGGFVSGLAESLTPGPVVEGLDDSWFLPNLLEYSAMDTLTKDNSTNRVPLLTGVTKQETGTGVKGGWRTDILNTLSKTTDFLKDALPKKLLKVNTGLLSNSALTGVLNKLFSNLDYVGGLTKTLDAVTSELDKVVELTTDALFNLPMFLTSKVWALASDTYVYSFEQKPKESTAFHFLDGLNIIRGGNQLQEPETSHGEDLIYLFDANSLDGNSQKYQISPNSEDMKIRNMFTTMVAEFARTGAPKIPNSNLNWPKFSAKESSFMVLSSQPKVDKDFRHCQMALWEGLSEILSSNKCSMLNLGQLLGAEKGLLGGLTGVNSSGKKVGILGGLSGGGSSGGLVGGVLPIGGGSKDRPNLVGGQVHNNNNGNGGLLGLGGSKNTPNRPDSNGSGNGGGLLGLPLGQNTQNREPTKNTPGQYEPSNTGGSGGLLGLPLRGQNNQNRGPPTSQPNYRETQQTTTHKRGLLGTGLRG